jgi:hypothetical protein
MKKQTKKLIIIFSIVISIFVIGIVCKTFQNDTFFNISIGKYILENGIDMKEHFCWVDNNLDYGYSHWAFDIIVYLIYSAFDFKGIYISVIIFTIIIALTLFYCLFKRNNSAIIAFFVTLISLYIIKDAFTARAQIVSFLCFIIEIYCIEKFIETNEKKYAIMIIIQSIIIANFHAATWPLTLVLFLPYIASELMNFISIKNKYKRKLKSINKKIQKLPKDSQKIEEYNKKIQECEMHISGEDGEYANYKVIRRKDYNIKNLIILLIIVLFTGLITPIHGTPYTYIINSMFGESNFESGSSMDYISEMQPIVPAYNLAIVAFSILLIAFLTFVSTKIKTEHGFLVLGLIIMTITSGRYVYLLVLLGSYVICDLITQALNMLISDDMVQLENILSKKIGIVTLLFLVSIFSINNILKIKNDDFVDESLYPVGAVNYILRELDYKNIRIFNSYNNGSYLMLNDIPVFIDSRLDVYCSEFNDTDIFKDYIKLHTGEVYYEDIFQKYDFTHILLKKDEMINIYIQNDSNYNILYQDDDYVLYERTLHQ